MLNKFIKIIVVASVGMVVLPIVSFSQSSFSSELGVEISPNYPRPNETVSINLSLYTADLNSADITWYQNDKSVLEGKGETRYSFKMGPVGEETKIEIRIGLLGGSSFSKVFTLTPASVDLVWEADSYVPPFYKGKALHARQGRLKIVAMPEFVKGEQRVPPQNLIYEWSNDVEAYQSQSGYGRNTLILNGSILGRNESVEVLVTDPVNNLVAQGFIDIAPIDPEIIFYENSPYYGHIFDSAIKNAFNLDAEEVQIWAAPYYFSKESSGNLKYEWRLNNATVTNLSDSRTAIFKKPEGESGESSISLSIQNLNRILQQGSASLKIKFEDK